MIALVRRIYQDLKCESCDRSVNFRLSKDAGGLRAYSTCPWCGNAESWAINDRWKRWAMRYRHRLKKRVR